MIIFQCVFPLTAFTTKYLNSIEMEKCSKMKISCRKMHSAEMHCLISSVGDIPSKRNVENENMQQLDALQTEAKIQ